MKRKQKKRLEKHQKNMHDKKKTKGAQTSTTYEQRGKVKNGTTSQKIDRTEL
jgi:hypothetical protein